MASFVREVLSATGTLGDIGNFPNKIGKIQKKLEDLKSSLLVHIDSKYCKFSSNISNANTLTSNLEELSIEIETLNNSINNHLKSQLGECNKELMELTNDIQELGLTLNIVNNIKVCYDAIEDGNELISEGKWLAASQMLNKSLTFVKNNSCDVAEENIKILPALKKEMIRQQQQLLESVCKQWHKNVTISSPSNNKNSILISFTGDNSTDVVHTMFYADLLTNQLEELALKMKKNFLEPILTQECTIKTEGKKLDLSLVATTVPEPRRVFQLVRMFFSFVSINLDIKLPGDSCVMSELSPLLATWLCDHMVRHVLAPAVPDTPDQLDTYQEIMDQTEQLQEYLVKINLISSDNLTLLNYAKNVDAIFASKLCQNLLSEAREIIKQDLFISTKVSPTKIKPENDSESDNLVTPSNFPLPHESFQFPECQVSNSAIELMTLVRKGLDDASDAKSMCQVRIFHTIRGIFSLWCAVTPIYHAQILSSLPQSAALAHNSAFYLAHQLVTLGFHYRDKLPGVTASTGGIPTFVDLVPKLREVGADLLLSSMRRHRDTLKQILNTAGFAALATDKRLCTGAEQGVKQVLHSLGHLHKVWSGVLPPNVYLQCMGTLLNTVMEEIIQIITTMEDISADAAEQLSTMLKQLVNKSPAHFQSEEPRKYVKKWNKFNILIYILGASLREIEDGWSGNGSHGNISQEFQPEQVKQLIRALFQNTERRAAVLAKIK